MASNIRSIVTLVAIGTICWIVAAAVALVMGADAKIIWTCISGAVLGLAGIGYSIRRAKRSGV